MCGSSGVSPNQAFPKSSSTSNPKWLLWAKQLQAIAQTGINYNQHPYPDSVFDVQRYEDVRKIAAEIMAEYSEVDADYVETLFAGDVGHATPKIDARGIVFRDDAILLVRERETQLKITVVTGFSHG